MVFPGLRRFWFDVLQLPHVEGGVRTIQIYKDNMYIGTTLNCILSANVTLTSAGPLVTGATINNAPITQVSTKLIGNNNNNSGFLYCA